MKEALAGLFGAGWELRRRAYARGWKRPQKVRGRVVSLGNLTVGGTGKTTLALHLADAARARGERPAVVLRRYRPGPAGRGDEELLFQAALGEAAVFAGTSKLEQARAAAAAGHDLILVDDGFSHWPLERDLDVVLLDSGDLLGGERLLPAGRLREPLRALQRADFVVITRVDAGVDLEAGFARVRRLAPAALLAAGRHVARRAALLRGGAFDANRVWILTATGNPAAVERSAIAAGYEVAGRTIFRDHHWFGADQVTAARAAAERSGARLLLTAKDAVRWPAGVDDGGAGVLEVAWEWVVGGEALEARVFAPAVAQNDAEALAGAERA